MNRTNIDPAILQEFLDSAANAHLKGQAQFFTPDAFAAQLAPALPLADATVWWDPTCGNAQWLAAMAAHPGAGRNAGGPEKLELLGMDIQPAIDRKAEWSAHLLHRFIPADLTLAYELMREIDWRLQGVALLNPPWDLHWHRSRLEGLATSDCPAVAAAWAGADPRLGPGLIDSTVATLMIALDRMRVKAEGVLIANDATLERLIFADGAPHSALATHCWARHRVPGNPMTGIAGAQFDDTFHTGVVYFARDHSGGPMEGQLSWPPVRDHRRGRRGAVLRSWDTGEETLAGWRALKEECAIRFQRRPAPFHVWLTPEGRIGTGLSLFDQYSSKVDKAAAKALDRLKGRRPLQVVTNREAREHLLGVVEDSPWRVDPKLREAVRSAVIEYDSARAPLAPLTEIQRVGYIDEHTGTIPCKALMMGARRANLGELTARRDPDPDNEGCYRVESTEGGRWQVMARSAKEAKAMVLAGVKQESAPWFCPGNAYALHSETIQYRWRQLRPSLDGCDELIELTGSELAIHVTGEEGVKVTFLDARCLERLTKEKLEGNPEYANARPLQEFVATFEIPAVPDITTLHPEAYAQNLKTLEELEALCP